MVRIWLKAFLAVALVVSGSAWLIAQERAQEVDEAEFRVREAKRIREQLNSRGLRTPACDSVLNSTQDPTQLLETKLRPLQPLQRARTSLPWWRSSGSPSLSVGTRTTNRQSGGKQRACP